MYFNESSFHVSIHAPARGATTLGESITRLPKVSIHAPARGATDAPSCVVSVCPSFNPRAREGRDGADLAAEAAIDVSIHAPARGATSMSPVARPTDCVFQSTRPRGARHRNSLRLFSSMTFQSTRPRGARPPMPPPRRGHRSFNPRAREGRDNKYSECHAMTPVSIHAPARGATKNGLKFWLVFLVSIHAPARGATGK